MDNKSDENIKQATIEANKLEIKSEKQYFDEKMMILTEEFKAMPTSTTTSMMDQINMSKSSSDQRN